MSSDAVSFCAFHINAPICLPQDVFERLCEKMQIEAHPVAPALRKVLKKLDLEYEHELLEEHHMQRIMNLGDDECTRLLESCYRPSGHFSAKALSNIEIDQVLDLLEVSYPDFCNLHINMINFDTYGGSLKQFTDQLESVMVSGKTKDIVLRLQETASTKTIPAATKKTRFATVLNSDRFGNGGKHWTCIFMDLRGPTFTIEFFNSSGNRAYPEVLTWSHRIARVIGTAMPEAIANASNNNMFIEVSDIQHQKGDTECGVYCLYYIFHRLKGENYRAFKKDPIPDDKVTEFRRYLFRPKN